MGMSEAGRGVLGTRREFLATAVAGLTVGIPTGFDSEATATTGVASPRHLAPERASIHWDRVAEEYSTDRSSIHLNAGGVSPTLEAVHRVLVEHLERANAFPFYALRARYQPEVQRVRGLLARALGCDPEEVALVRNASEAMETCQLGVELVAGDEVLITSLEFPRMANTWEQRVRREGIVVRVIQVNEPFSDPSGLLERLESALTPRTRLISIPHMADVNGQIMPVVEIAAVARRRGILLLVDGAQTFGQLDFKVSDLGCDFFATSLHKWLGGPHGTGALFVRRDRIPQVWPLMPSSLDDREDIRKFEDIGTDQWVRTLALAEALSLHARLGATAREERLRHVRDTWLTPLLEVPGVHLSTSTHRAASCSLTTIGAEGMDPVAFRDHLWEIHRIRVRPIDRPGIRGIRVSAGLHNSESDLEHFVEVVRPLLERGLPV